MGCAVAVMCCATFLIFHCRYEDGLIGRAALVILAFAEFVVIYEWLTVGDHYTVLPTTYAVQLGITLFLMRHVYRFWRWQRRGDFDWRGIRK